VEDVRELRKKKEKKKRWRTEETTVEKYSI
jgi:hypothetical protein